LKLAQRVNRIISAVKRMPNWVQLLQSADPEQQRAAVDGIRKESWLLLKRSFSLWLWLRTHKLEFKKQGDGKDAV